MTRPKLPLLACLICSAMISEAQQSAPDNNISISSMTEVYEYKKGDKQNPVVVKQTSATTYYCNSFRSTIPIVEGYDGKTTIDDVSVYINGLRANVKPTYDYYSVENIFYSDQRVCYFNLRLEKKGSTSEVRIEKTVTDPRYFTAIYLNEPYTTSSKEVKIIIPRWMKVELKELNFNKTITKIVSYNAKTDADVYTYQIDNAEASRKESNSPGPSFIYPHLQVLNKSAKPGDAVITYFNSLADQYAWYRSLVEQVANDEAVLKTKALDITQGKDNNLAKVRAIYQWVQENIRYIAFEDGIAGFKPESAQEVLRKKYGDCKGMANLTKGLLKSIGFDARLCWIGTNHIAYDYSTPSLGVDNHMICALFLDKKLYFLDATETYIGFGQFAERIQGRQVLIENGNEYILEHVPVETYLQNVEQEKRVISISGDTLKGRVYQNWKGESREHLLAGINNIRKEKVADAIVRYLSDGQDILTDVKTSDLSSQSEDISIEYNLKLKNGASSFGNEVYVEMDRRKELASMTMDTVERKTDWLFPYKYDLQHETQLSLPKGGKIASLPEPVQIDRPGYRFTISYARADDKIIYKKELIFKKSSLPRSAFAQWNKDIREINRIYNEQLVISK